MTLLLFGKINVWITIILLAIILTPYIYLISRQPSEIKNMKISEKIKKLLSLMVKHSRQDVNCGKITKITFIDLLIASTLLLIIIASSYFLLFSAIELANYWGISYVIVGTLAIAGLTSIPNLITAILLARKGFWNAVISETFNSNTLNFITGICLPALIFGMGKVSMGIKFSIFWLLGITLFTIISLSFPKWLHRLTGASIIVLYCVYVLIIITYHIE
jgi:cation:H+ antiporter